MCRLICYLFISFSFMQSSYPLNSIPISSRDLSFSGGGGAIKSNQITLNPANILSNENSLSFHTQLLPLDISLLSIQGIYPKNNTIYFVSASNLNFGILKDGITNKTFSANDIMISTGFKRPLFNIISFGTSISYTLSKIKNSTAQSILFSGGIRTEIIKKIGLGVSVRNVGFQFDNFGEANEKLPLQIQFSTFIRPKYLPALIFSDIVKDENISYFRFISGLSFYSTNKFNFRLSNSGFFRGGYQLDGIALGMKFNLKSWVIELASRNLISTGFINAFSVRKNF